MIYSRATIVSLDQVSFLGVKLAKKEYLKICRLLYTPQYCIPTKLTLSVSLKVKHFRSGATLGLIIPVCQIFLSFCHCRENTRTTGDIFTAFFVNFSDYQALTSEIIDNILFTNE